MVRPVLDKSKKLRLTDVLHLFQSMGRDNGV